MLFLDCRQSKSYAYVLFQTGLEILEDFGYWSLMKSREYSRQ